MAQQVTVAIVNNSIVVTPDRLPMGKQKSQPIHWTIDTNGWTFPADGIVITNPGDQFYDGGKETGNDRKFKWHDKNTVAGEYKYIVKVINSANNPPTLTLDPIIVNEV